MQEHSIHILSTTKQNRIVIDTFWTSNLYDNGVKFYL